MELKEAIKITSEYIKVMKPVFIVLGNDEINANLKKTEVEAFETILQALEKREVGYNSKTKTLDGNILLTPLESMILEAIAKMKGDPIQAKEIQQAINRKCGNEISLGNIKVHVCRINKKTKGLIKYRRCYGYYIDKEIKNG